MLSCLHISLPLFPTFSFLMPSSLFIYILLSLGLTASAFLFSHIDYIEYMAHEHFHLFLFSPAFPRFLPLS